MEQLENILRATGLGFQASLYQHMPPSVYRTFHLWALSTKNPQANYWQQMLGFPQMAKLTHRLLAKSVRVDQWDELVRYSTYLNSYLIYEAVSDNLAFGLAVRRPDDRTYDQRRAILIDFNDAMILRLRGQHTQSDNLLGRLQHCMAGISGFDQSLTTHEQRTIAEEFLRQHPQYTMDDIEFGTWNALVANIQSCAEAADRMNDFQLGDFFRQGLISRYEAVNALLHQNVTEQDALIKVSTDTILVIPVLTYYTAVLMEKLDRNPALGTLIESGALFEAMEDAALLTRLLNDIGTNLVATDQFYAHLLNDLYMQLSPTASHVATLGDLLLRHGERSELMTRIRKDVTFAEFNVSLHNLMTAPPTPLSLLLFGNNLVYFQHLYRERRNRLINNLQIIRQTLKNDSVVALIEGFVRFHEYIYQYQFDEQAGDYATKPDVHSAAD